MLRPACFVLWTQDAGRRTQDLLPKLIELLIRITLQFVQRPFDTTPPLLHLPIARYRDRLAVEEDRARERYGDDHPVPGAQQLFFFAAKATGTMGSPVACAATITPSLATRAGPFGPSGVKTMFFPPRAARIISRSAGVPPRVEEPRADSTP